MANFSQAVSKVLRHERGYQNDPDDMGSYNAYTVDGTFLKTYAERKAYPTERVGTNRGVSAGLYSSLLKRAVSVEEMKAITQAQAVDVYRRVFWDKMSGDDIKSQALAEVIFDGYVNQGPYANTLLQAVLNGMGANLEVDGIIGPLTVQAINKAPEQKLYCSYVSARRKAYQKRAAEVPGQSVFLNGWLNRLNEYAKDCPTDGAPTNGLATAGLFALLLFTILE